MWVLRSPFFYLPIGMRKLLRCTHTHIRQPAHRMLAERIQHQIRHGHIRTPVPMCAYNIFQKFSSSRSDPLNLIDMIRTWKLFLCRFVSVCVRVCVFFVAIAFTVVRRPSRSPLRLPCAHLWDKWDEISSSKYKLSNVNKVFTFYMPNQKQL